MPPSEPASPHQRGSIDGFGAAVSSRSYDEVTVRDLRVRHTPSPIGGLAKATITGSQIDGPAHLSGGLGPIEVSDSRLDQVRMEFLNGAPPRLVGNTFSSSSVFASQVGPLTITDNTFSGADTAVALFKGNGSSITGNRFTGNEVGLRLSESWGTTVKDNVFARNSGVGMVLRGPVLFPGTVSHNVFRNNGASGLYAHTFSQSAYPEGSRIIDNVFTRNGFDPGEWVDTSGAPLTAGARIAPSGPSGTTVANNVAQANAGVGLSTVNVIDDGGNRARGNRGPAQCTGLAC